MPKRQAALPTIPSRITALVVRQWLDDWDIVHYDATVKRGKPEPRFYLFSADASALRRLSGVYRRKADRPRSQDLAIQRRLDEERAEEIAAFIKGGFPWSVATSRQRESDQFRDLRMPGWLPTAIIANILPPGSRRDDDVISKDDVINIQKERAGFASLVIPDQANDPDWRPRVPPLEIIDGQHRLLAFDYAGNVRGDYQLPVVAFYDLDAAWQAYLFYTINIKPKRINASLAYDLYPLLRTQEWLEGFEGPSAYRETRAQELTEVLWRHPQSPWCKRINMLGDPGAGTITQAAFVRSLLATFVKKWESPRSRIGGLFGAEMRSTKDVLPWSRMQQAAFLIAGWQRIQAAVLKSKGTWAKDLRQLAKRETEVDSVAGDPAFAGKFSLLASDQGVRGVLYVLNDLFYVRTQELGLPSWRPKLLAGGSDDDRISSILNEIDQPILRFLDALADQLATFEWRTSSTPGLSGDLRLKQAAFRGSGGYRDLRHQLLLTLSRSPGSDVRSAATDVISSLGYSE